MFQFPIELLLLINHLLNFIPSAVSSILNNKLALKKLMNTFYENLSVRKIDEEKKIPIKH